MTVGPVGAPAPDNSHVRVVVRVRPENRQEIDGGYRDIVQPLDENVLIFDPKEEGSPGFYQGRRRRGRDMNKKANRDMQFAFDRVFGNNSTNEEVYEETTLSILDGLLEGYNCSVFAYGATGAGKTFTMLGSEVCPGVIFLTMMELYKRIDLIKEDKTCDVAVSYMEVYNEQIRDLLMPGGFLPIREDPQKGVVIAGLSLHKPTTAEELFHMLEFGNKNRSQHPTDANAESSRSHAVFQVFVRQRPRTASLSANMTVGKMSLIDLAGSERGSVTKNKGARFREGANINRSLLALGNCINALAAGKKKGFVPYRNSKLTRLLKDSLGGNCRTVMIAAVSPSAMTYEDTYNTLKYADRAKQIKASLKKNTVNVDFHVAKYAKIVEELRSEVQELKTKLVEYERGTVVKDRTQSVDVPAQQELDRLQDGVYRVFQQRCSIRRELLELHGKDYDITYRMHCKEVRLNRQELLLMDTEMLVKARGRMAGVSEGSRKRRAGIQQRRVAVDERMAENEAALARCMQEVETYAQQSAGGQVPEVLDNQLRCHHLETELRDTRRHAKFLKKLCRVQQQESSHTEKLLCSLLATVKRQFLLLKSHSLASSDVVADFTAVSRMAEGEREVAWADQSSVEGVSGDASMLGVSMNAQAGDNAAGLDVTSVTSFPILSCVSLTPKHPCRGRNYRGDRTTATPHRTPAGRSHTPSHTPAGHVQSDGTPNSGSRRRRTPRRLNQTPAHQTLQEESSSPHSVQPGSASCTQSHPPSGDSNPHQQPATRCDSTSTQNHAQPPSQNTPHTVNPESCHQTFRGSGCTSQPVIDKTHAEPALPQPLPSHNTPAAHPHHPVPPPHHAAPSAPPHHIAPAAPAPPPQAAPRLPASALNSTYVYDDDVFSLKVSADGSDSGRSSQNSPNHRVDADQTVVLTTSHVPAAMLPRIQDETQDMSCDKNPTTQLVTAPRQKFTDSGTITKSKPDVLSPPRPRARVARAMDFDNMAQDEEKSPGSKSTTHQTMGMGAQSVAQQASEGVSFAEMLKSPAPGKTVQRASQPATEESAPRSQRPSQPATEESAPRSQCPSQPATEESAPRSPLMSCENLPARNQQPKSGGLKRSKSVSAVRVPAQQKHAHGAFTPATDDLFKAPLPAGAGGRFSSARFSEYTRSGASHPRESRFSEYTRGGVGASHVSESLRRAGLPSMLERPRTTSMSSSSFAGPELSAVPSYMRATKSVARRNRNHRSHGNHPRSISADGGAAPRIDSAHLAPQRVPAQNKENSRPPVQPQRVMSKSKSSSGFQHPRKFNCY